MSFVQLLLSSVVLNVTGNILLKKGVTAIGGVTGEKAKLVSDLTKAALNPLILFGLVLYGFSFVIWLRVLSFNDLSKSYPIFASIVFLLTTVGSVIFLKETVSAMRILGTIIIIAGIFIVARY